MIIRLFVLAAICSPAPAADAQVVQLPTFRSFGYVGSVSVPDGGTMSLGGNSTMSSSVARRGGIGTMRTAGGAAASVTIIDHDAIDRRLRGLDQSAMQSVKTKTMIEEGKTLVRYARKMRASGNDTIAQQAYQLALPKLDQRLRGLAFREFERAYPRAAKLPSRLR